jgi:hypothetical protein
MKMILNQSLEFIIFFTQVQMKTSFVLTLYRGVCSNQYKHSERSSEKVLEPVPKSCKIEIKVVENKSYEMESQEGGVCSSF